MHCMCIVRQSSTLAILVNQSTGTITDHGQSAKDIDTYFMSQFYVEDHVPLVVDGIRTTTS